MRRQKFDREKSERILNLIKKYDSPEEHSTPSKEIPIYVFTQEYVCLGERIKVL